MAKQIKEPVVRNVSREAIIERPEPWEESWPPTVIGYIYRVNGREVTKEEYEAALKRAVAKYE